MEVPSEVDAATLASGPLATAKVEGGALTFTDLTPGGRYVAVAGDGSAILFGPEPPAKAKAKTGRARIIRERARAKPHRSASLALRRCP
jgi:hypothetical protein